MNLESSVWSVMQKLGVDEFIATHTDTNSLLRKVIPRSRAYTNEKYEHRINEKLKVILNRADYTQWRLFSGNLAINQNILKYLSTADDFVMFDIGANIGGFSILLSNEINVEKFSVHLFEPNPGLVPILKENIHRLCDSNHSIHVEINPVAVGDTHTTLPLRIPENHTGLATLAQTHNVFDRCVDVDVILVDDYVEEHKLARVDLIKIDVESYEPSVLKGALKTLQRFRPVLYMEYSSEWFENFDEEYVKSLFSTLYDLDYHFYREGKDGSLNPLELTKTALSEYSHLNILAA